MHCQGTLEKSTLGGCEIAGRALDSMKYEAAGVRRSHLPRREETVRNAQKRSEEQTGSVRAVVGGLAGAALQSGIGLRESAVGARLYKAA